MVICDKNGNRIIFQGKIINSLQLWCKNKFSVNGKDNTIIIEGGGRIHEGTFLIIGNKNRILIKEDTECGNFILRTDGDGNKIIIGKNVYFGGGCLHAMDGTKIEIGDYCMLSHDIDIRSGDGHPIYLNDERLRYNKGKDISIGKHVWIGIRMQILKGVIIKDNCIIGASSVVYKSFQEENCILAGYPAKIIKENVRWER